MSILKSELKQLVTHEVGVRVDDALEAAKRELAVTEGRHSGFMEGAKAVEALQATVDADVEAEKYDLVVSEQVKRYLTRAVHALQNLAQQSVHFKMAQTGKIQGFEHTITLLKGIIDEEKAKATQFAQAVAAGRVDGDEDRPLNVRMTSLKSERLAEENDEPKVEVEQETAAEAHNKTEEVDSMPKPQSELSETQGDLRADSGSESPATV